MGIVSGWLHSAQCTPHFGSIFFKFTAVFACFVCCCGTHIHRRQDNDCMPAAEECERKRRHVWRWRENKSSSTNWDINLLDPTNWWWPPFGNIFLSSASQINNRNFWHEANLLPSRAFYFFFSFVFFLFCFCIFFSNIFFSVTRSHDGQHCKTAKQCVCIEWFCCENWSRISRHFSMRLQ